MKVRDTGKQQVCDVPAEQRIHVDDIDFERVKHDGVDEFGIFVTRLH